VIDPAIFAGDPPIPADGSCFVCGKPRRPERSRRYAGMLAEMDSFCSSTCSRAYHGNPLPTGSIWSKPGSPNRLEPGRTA